MRNVFDQYSQHENRLTHALASSLASEPKLLRRFLLEVAGCKRPLPRILRVEEQKLPGERPPGEAEADSRGLPDAWIHDEESWSLLIESKVSSAVVKNQLDRHLATARRRGFDDVSLLVIGTALGRAALPAKTLFVTWSDVYGWLRKQTGLEWASRASEYMEVAEGRMIDDGYLKEGKLTKFAGIPFGPEYEYNYTEAKRVLKLAMDELRSRKDLEQELGADLKAQGRPAITGKNRPVVWDLIPLKQASKAEPFTKFPHFTLGIGRERVDAHMPLPNGMKRELRKNLKDLGPDGFIDVVHEVERNMRKVLRGVPGAAPWFWAVQRHYPSIGANPVIDARLEFDLRTALERKAKNHKSGVKPQIQWVNSAYDALVHRKSNYQPSIGAVFAYADRSKISREAAVDVIAGAWIACKPMLDAALGK